ncbi:NAD(P)-binding protein [Lentithecium fluviatile CBS 122367]|uniref:NAD(P)-binding protein n=1 Tax=Lentithecium fluviatile CBS 122367 TaxID=1168545 RepID=A0A6G1IPN9_9PLEO|nr:NAD(P)-binding protein [Lentithecium fluviatile CBS 122367]
MAPTIQTPLLPAGSLVLVTAANGLIASHIVSELLTYNYRVRTTVRSRIRCSWLLPLFKSLHPTSTLEVVEIPDINAPGCYDAALKGASAVIHTAANTSLSAEEGQDFVQETVDANINVLEAVRNANGNGEQVKRVVLTSSSWAVCYPQPNIEKELTPDTCDTFAESPDLPKEYRGLMTYVVSKKRSEQESWKWWEEHRRDCGFVLNTVMPSTCMGPVLDPENQAYPSTAEFVRSLYEGKNMELFGWLEPQWYVDVRDAARLHVAGTVLAGVEGDRIYGFAETWAWLGVAGVIEREMGCKMPIQLKDKRKDLTTPVTRDLNEGHLKQLGLNGWIPFEESVGDNIRSFYPKA